MSTQTRIVSPSFVLLQPNMLRLGPRRLPLHLYIGVPNWQAFERVDVSFSLENTTTQGENPPPHKEDVPQAKEYLATVES